MPADEPAGPATRTKLARLRRERDINQSRLASLTGIGYRTLQRLEAGEMPNPPLRYLVNCAIVLQCELSDLVEDEWLEWLPLDPPFAAKPRDPQTLDDLPNRLRRLR